MRLTGWHIDGFGVFAGVTLDGLPAGLGVFHGANEAGKSTLLGFIRALLFGFPRANARNESQYPPLAGGRHGGRLTLELESAGEYTVERYHGRGGGLTVLGADQSTGGEDLLQHVMGGVSAAVYKSIYAFSLSELQDFASVREAGLQGALYGVGTGAASRSLPAARERLEKRLSELFKRGGSNPRLNQVLSALEDVQIGRAHV